MAITDTLATVPLLLMVGTFTNLDTVFTDYEH